MFFKRVIQLAVLLMTVGMLLGCDAIKEATGQADSASKDTKKAKQQPKNVATKPQTKEGVRMKAPPPAEAPELVLSMFRRMQPAHIRDEHIERVASLKTGPEQITELDLSAARITKRGIDALAAFTSLRELNLSGLPLEGGPAYSGLAKLTGLRVLNLDKALFNTSAMQYLAPLTSLVELNLNGTRIADEGFVHLKNHSNLEIIRVSRTVIDGSGFEAFNAKHAKSPLRIIEADKTRFGFQGFKYIQGLKTLEELSCIDANVSNAAMQGLKGMTNLRVLNLGSNILGDPGLPNLKYVKNLEKLNLSNNAQVTNVGLVVLKRLKKIYELDIDRTKCTDQAALELKKLFPDAKIIWKGRIL